MGDVGFYTIVALECIFWPTFAVWLYLFARNKWDDHQDAKELTAADAAKEE